MKKGKVINFSSSVAEKMDKQDSEDGRYLPPLLSIDEVCEYLGLGKTIVYEMVQKGEIPHIRVRSRIRVSADDLLGYLNARRKESV